jgi:hypothetical protein
MLTAYRRHRKDCTHRQAGRKYRRCRCPIWVDGFVGQQEIRKALGTRDWDEAQKTVREWEATGVLPVPQDEQPIGPEQAMAEFIADAEARNLKDCLQIPASLSSADGILRKSGNPLLE